MMLWLENYIFRNRTECVFDISKQKHIILLPGMIGPVWMLFGVVRYLRMYISDYGVTVISLGLSLDVFENLVQNCVIRIKKKLLNKVSVSEIVFYGHSHGGRIACAVQQQLQKEFPQITYSVITAGTPMEKPRYLFHKFHFYLLPISSKSFRVWPHIIQPNKNNMCYIGLYSDYDRIVPEKNAIHGHNGELRMISGFTHTDFIRAEKMGPILIDILKIHS